MVDKTKSCLFTHVKPNTVWQDMFTSYSQKYFYAIRPYCTLCFCFILNNMNIKLCPTTKQKPVNRQILCQWCKLQRRNLIGLHLIFFEKLELNLPFQTPPTPHITECTFIYNVLGGDPEEKKVCCYFRYPAISSDAGIQLLTRAMLSVHYTSNLMS